MKVLYVVDPTARQYAFQINEGLKLKIGNTYHTITGVESDIEIFHEAITKGDSLVIYGIENFVVFAGDKIIGIKILQE